MIRSDNHVHTSFSSDSTTPMETMLQQGIKLGLSSLCFTDHIDYHFPKERYGMDFDFSMESYFRQTADLSKKYSEISIRTGVELGLKEDVLEKNLTLTRSYPFDFVIGSTHLVDDIDPYYPEYWETYGEEAGIHHYYEVTLQNIENDFDYDVYGHIDYVIRYCPTIKEARKQQIIREDYYLDIMKRERDITGAILKTLIEKEKGIEVNTGGFKYGLGHPNPHEEILCLYRDLGGDTITLGSDAHEEQYLAFSFEKLPALLKKCGFTYYTEFSVRKPKRVSL